RVLNAIREAQSRNGQQIVVALDGPSGSGKSTIADLVLEAMNAVVVPCDDFFAAEITDAGWNARDPRERAADALDWRRLRREAIEPLLAGKTARWHALDFEAGIRPDGTYAMQKEHTECHPASIIILDGAYAARPELADIVDL